MKSMTGYGRYNVEVDGRNLLIELKSVNHRFLDLNIKLPRIHNFAESIIRNCVQKYFNRGHIDIYITFTDNRENKSEITYDNGIVKEYKKIAQEIETHEGINNDLSTVTVMRMPDVISLKAIEDNEDLLKKLYSDVIDGACKSLENMRKIEGAPIKDEMISRLSFIKKSLEKIKVFAPKVVEDYRAKITDRMTEVLKDVEIDETRLLNEVAFFADKCCIDEEISRLDVHLVNMAKKIEDEKPIGRSMDFLIQEMNRETNTMGSKANDINITNEVLKIKSEIEKMREQVQNIE